ncbi:hydantoinase/carbamoylase family amidase [Acidimicrobiaceae bacterium USS-CC1]|uniref:Hydantoinase/carbamoylase family amidase n=1 Tax=Acidiferrimicrobium australe TaxID=2664430 RepID=A0ABW9QT68_9ACTN|nr:hydantoinase/carbamoylase family amidase [Acidiferrimicrobium australe]
MTLPAEVAAAVDGRRLGALIRDVSTLGGLPGGGLDRQTLTKPDLDARRLMVDRCCSLGAQPWRDPAGNFFLRWPATASDEPPVATGSHIDSQPGGGTLDGAYGVCAAIEVLAALASTGARLRRPVEAVIWTNEEGCRFAPGTMGSSAFADPSALDEFLAATDGSGATFGEGLAQLDAAFPDVPLRPLGVPLHAFVEAHIEQGTTLEDTANTIGIVERIQGSRWFRFQTRGAASHAGTTPRSRKRDALAAAVEVASALYGLLTEGDDALRLTIGRLEVVPGSVNVVPAAVTFTVDLRHPDTEVLDEVEARLRALARPTAGCDVQVMRTMTMSPSLFHPAVVDAVARGARSVGLPSLRMASGAFHDSLRLIRHCPTGMVFVPSRDGLSHNTAEYTDPDDLVAGARVLAHAVAELAGR